MDKKKAIIRLILHELRVDYNEEFKLSGCDEIFRITENDIEMWSEDLNKLYKDKCWRTADMRFLKKIIFEGASIVHAPFVPKHGETFYTYYGTIKPWSIRAETYEGTLDQILRVHNGFSFRSKESALAMRPYKEKDLEAILDSMRGPHVGYTPARGDRLKGE